MMLRVNDIKGYGVNSEAQLTFNIENSASALSLEEKISEACESMDKVRKKIFAEMAALKKEMQALKIENETLKSKMENLKNDSSQLTSKSQWGYGQDSCLFTMRDSKAI